MNINRFNVYFWLRKKTIYCYIYQNGKKCIDFSTGLKCNENEWNKEEQNCKIFHIQRELETIKRKVFDLKNGMDLSEKPYDCEILKSMYLNSQVPPMRFIDVFEALIEHKKAQRKEKETVRTYRTRINILKRYLIEKKQIQIPIDQITIIWSEQFKKWLSVYYPADRSNYANKVLQACYSVMKHGHRLGYIQNNALQYMEYFPRKVKAKIYLTLDELTELEKFVPTQLALQRVKDLFLWQCYTGMDYSTMSEFKSEYVKQSQKGMYIDGKRIKTDSRYVLPFFPKALEIWNKYGGSLPIISNQKYNAYLKNVIEMCDIEKQITTHSGRKTFANYWESKGIDRRTIADMLGHKKIDTTLQHYSEVQIEGLWLKVA